MAQSPGLIQLQPNTPNSQQIQLINDNFHTVSNLLTTNSFIIVLSATYTFPAITSVTGFNSTFQDLKVAHNLNVPPAFEIFAQIPKPADAAATAYNQFPSSFYVNVSQASNFYHDSTDAQMFNAIYSGVDSTFLYITREANNSSAGALAASAISIVYYVLQKQSAGS